jgi:ATP-dependent DNA helicase RecG
MAPGDVARALESPNTEVGARLLSVAEDQWFERKSRRIEPRRLAEALVGFANADGGTIVVGLSKGSVEGTHVDPRRRNELMQAAMDFTQPAVAIRSALCACVRDDGQPDELLVIEVAPSNVVHANSRDDVFLRVGDETRRLTFAQCRELLFDKGQAAYESEPTDVPVTAVDDAVLDGYADRLGAADPMRLLAARGLYVDGHLTVAGCLLFAREPEREFPNAHLRVSLFRGSQRGSGSRQSLADDVRIEGPIPLVLERARRQIEAWQPTRRALSRTGTFEDIGLVPQDAWWEGVVNAAVHRSYSMAGDHIHVDIFDDRIEIESPGRFPGLVDFEHPEHMTRFARNPRIARVCADLRIGQELGEGIRRMFDEMRAAGLTDPFYMQTSGSVRLTLSGEPVHRELDARLPGATRAIVQALREAERLSTGELAELIDVARPTMLRYLHSLKDAEIVEWVGKSERDPRAYWRLR